MTEAEARKLKPGDEILIRAYVSEYDYEYDPGRGLWIETTVSNADYDQTPGYVHPADIILKVNSDDNQ